MHPVQRRFFLKFVAAPLAVSAMAPSWAAAQSSLPPVSFAGDGLNLSPTEYADLLGT
jgi:hypothetical protein